MEFEQSIPVKNNEDLEPKTAVRVFLDRLYPDGDHIVTFALDRATGAKMQRFFPNTPEGRTAAADYLVSESLQGRDVYHGAHTFKENGQRTKENAADTITALWSESDKARPNGVVPQPSITVESSPGHFHDYWTLTEPISSKRAERLNRRIALAMGSDAGWALSKVLRPPETYNFKYEPPTKTSATYTDHVYDPEHLEVVLPPLPEPRSHTRDTDEPPVNLDARGLRVWNGDDPKLANSGTWTAPGRL
jgi:hypothetical protein